MGSRTARDQRAPRHGGAHRVAFRFSLQRRRPGHSTLRGSIPSPPFPLSTLRRRPRERRRMTRGRRGWLPLQRTTFSFASIHRPPGTQRRLDGRSLWSANYAPEITRKKCQPSGRAFAKWSRRLQMCSWPVPTHANETELGFAVASRALGTQVAASTTIANAGRHLALAPLVRPQRGKRLSVPGPADRQVVRLERTPSPRLGGRSPRIPRAMCGPLAPARASSKALPEATGLRATSLQRFPRPRCRRPGCR